MTPRFWPRNAVDTTTAMMSRNRLMTAALVINMGTTPQITATTPPTYPEVKCARW
jgi:hypothetical protein